MVISVQLQPRARRSEVVEATEGIVRARVTAPPQGGKANEALVALLAETLGVPRSRVRVKQGFTSRRKLVEVDGLAEEEAWHRLAVAGKPRKRPG